MFMQKILIILSLFSATNAHAWGRWGHFMVGSGAATLLSESLPNTAILKSHAFDLGYYSNVPDMVWKADTKIYTIEHPEHFMDLEIFIREMKGAPFPADRKTFETKFPTISSDAGRSYYRIQEFVAALDATTQKIKSKKPMDKDYQTLQGEWLTEAGLMGHYVGDLSQPLHCTENFDGTMTNAKGIHSFFEDILVNEMHQELSELVTKKVKKSWPDFHKAHANKTPFQMMEELCKDSNSKVSALLAIDKKVGRTDMAKAKAAYKDLLVERLTLGTLHLAEVWSRYVGWEYNGTFFYYFNAKPSYVYPPKTAK
jgi:hypothetical protein